MTTATVPVFIEQHASQGSMSPGVVPSMLPPFDAQPIPNTPGPSSSRRASFAGVGPTNEGYFPGPASPVHTLSGTEPPPGFMATAVPLESSGQRTPSLRHTSLSRPQSRMSIASSHSHRTGRVPLQPTIMEEADGFPPEGSAAEYYNHQREPANGYFDRDAGGRASPAMSAVSARRVPLPPGSSIGEESRPASRASRTYGHTPYRRPTSGLYD